MTHSLLGTDSIKGFRTGSELKTVLTGSQSRMTFSPREHLVMSRGELAWQLQSRDSSKQRPGVLLSVVPRIRHTGKELAASVLVTFVAP